MNRLMPRARCRPIAPSKSILVNPRILISSRQQPPLLSLLAKAGVKEVVRLSAKYPSLVAFDRVEAEPELAWIPLDTTRRWPYPASAPFMTFLHKKAS